MLDLTNMLKYRVHFLHVLDLPAADIIRQYTSLQKGFIYTIYVQHILDTTCFLIGWKSIFIFV